MLSHVTSSYDEEGGGYVHAETAVSATAVEGANVDTVHVHTSSSADPSIHMMPLPSPRLGAAVSPAVQHFGAPHPQWTAPVHSPSPRASFSTSLAAIAEQQAELSQQQEQLQHYLSRAQLLQLQQQQQQQQQQASSAGSPPPPPANRERYEATAVPFTSLLSTVSLSDKPATTTTEQYGLPPPVTDTENGDGDTPTDDTAPSCLNMCCEIACRLCCKCLCGKKRRKAKPTPVQYVEMKRSDSLSKNAPTVATAAEQAASPQKARAAKKRSLWFRRPIACVFAILVIVVGGLYLGKYLGIPLATRLLTPRSMHAHDIYRPYNLLEIDSTFMYGVVEKMNKFLETTNPNEKPHTCISSLEVQNPDDTFTTHHIAIRNTHAFAGYYNRPSGEKFWHLINPTVEFSNVTVSGEPINVETKYVTETPSHCGKHSRDWPPGFNEGTRVRPRASHVIVRYYDILDKTYKRTSFINTYAYCVQHYNDVFQDLWPCSPHEHDEL